MKPKDILLRIIMISLLCANVFAIEKGGAAIAVSSEGNAADSLISSEAARCPFFLIFNDKGEFVEALKNPMSRNQRGAGAEVVEFLKSKGVGTVIAQRAGEKMSSAMKKNGMSFYEEKGSATNAVKRVLKPEKE